jgi:hypothetical protein
MARWAQSSDTVLLILITAYKTPSNTFTFIVQDFRGQLKVKNKLHISDTHIYQYERVAVQHKKIVFDLHITFSVWR